MKIYSKFHDYYDCIQKMGVDKSVVYNRKTEEVCYDTSYKLDLSRLKFLYGFPIGIPRDQDIVTTYGSESVDFFIVGFCGELYPGLKIKSNDRSNEIKETFLYSLEETDEYFSYVENNIPKSRKARETIWRSMVFDENSKEKFLSWMKDLYYPHSFYSDRDKLDLGTVRSWFLKHRIPIFLLELGSCGEKLSLNPCLKDIHFFKKIHPQDAFQRIQQFISNDLATPMDGLIAPVKEKDRLIGHGFDPKWSFRKEAEVSKI